MIRRDDGGDWLLISQVDHAHLAAEVAAAWGNSDVASLPVPEMLVPAIRDHDNGWLAWEDAPETDPQTGRPRGFTEMPMTAATRIWTESIASCARGTYSHAEAVSRFQDWLRAQGYPLTMERASVLDAALGFRGLFGVGELQRAINKAGPLQLSRIDLRLILGEMSSAQIAHCAQHRLREPALCEITVPRIGHAPLGGLWVSRHFCWLAEQARPSRQEHREELAALDQFLDEQARQQAAWIDEAVREFAGEHLDRLLNAGFRYVQFFDRVSLWLCCAERTEPEEIELPSGQPIRFIPESATEIAVEPYPLSVESLELIVPARRVPARRYTDDADLHQTLQNAPTEQLRWTLRPRAPAPHRRW